ncbi:YybH family protein [Nitrospira sp. Nam74]
MGVTNPDNLHKAFETAFNSANVEAVLALYEPEASLVPQPGTVAQGRSSIKQALQQFLAVRGTMRIETVYVMKQGGIALTRGQWHLNGKDPQGHPIEISGKSVEVARQQPTGEWLLAIDHPFGAD